MQCLLLNGIRFVLELLSASNERWCLVPVQSMSSSISLPIHLPDGLLISLVLDNLFDPGNLVSSLLGQGIPWCIRRRRQWQIIQFFLVSSRWCLVVHLSKATTVLPSEVRKDCTRYDQESAENCLETFTTVSLLLGHGMLFPDESSKTYRTGDNCNLSFPSEKGSGVLVGCMIGKKLGGHWHCHIGKVEWARCLSALWGEDF